MMIKRAIVTLLFIVILTTSVGCFLRSENKVPSKDFLSYEEIAGIYNANKDIINSIKDVLLSSNFVPTKKKSISLYYADGQLVCSDDAQGEKLHVIQNIHDDVVDFLQTYRELRPLIMFRTVDEKIIIEFEFRSNNAKEDCRAGIIYTTTPKEPWGELLLEDNWYAYKYTMD